jgi:hypothetical protein
VTRKRSRVVREGAERKGPATEPRPPPTSCHGHGARVVVVGVTTHQGGREGRPQGEDWQVLGANEKGGIRDGERRNWTNAHRLRGSSTGERRVRKPTCVVRGRAGGKRRCESYLACGLSYYALSYRDLEEMMVERGLSWTTPRSTVGYNTMPPS